MFPKHHHKRSNFMTWLLLILPVFLFIIILWWAFNKLLWWAWKIVQMLPQSFVWFFWTSEILVHVLCLLLLFWIIWLLGLIINRWKVGKRIKNNLTSVISRVPLLNSLSRITNQIANTLETSDSFKKVVLLKFPAQKTWSIGFVTGENTSMFDKELDEDELVSIFIPTTPNPTNGFLVLLKPKDFIETDVPVSTALSFIISMGTAGATEEVMKTTKNNKK